MVPGTIISSMVRAPLFALDHLQLPPTPNIMRQPPYIDVGDDKEKNVRSTTVFH